MRIREAIGGLRPLLKLSDPHTIDLVSFDITTGIVVLELYGGCVDCDMPVAALMGGIEAHLKLRVPEVRTVKAAEISGKVAAGESGVRSGAPAATVKGGESGRA